MCLGIPARIVSVGFGDQVSRPAVLERNDGAAMTADLVMVPEARPGDYVVAHSGFAISLLTEDEALQAICLFDEMKDGVSTTTAT